MKRIAYLDIIGGLSGDMLLAAMIDAGASAAELENEIKRVVPEDFELVATKTKRGSIEATHVDVAVRDSRRTRWDWGDFRRAYEGSDLPEEEKATIERIFERLRIGEMGAHDTEESPHLHELGTVDTLVDIAGAVIGLRLLGIDALRCSSLPASLGVSKSSHGTGASIAPATMAIIRECLLPLRVGGPGQPVGEAVTPTGAAIVASIASFAPVEMTVIDVGYGAGTRETHDPPNVLGLWLGDENVSQPDFVSMAEAAGALNESDVTLFETNLDDMTGEEIGHVMRRLMDKGALDAWVTPIQMKKNRPGVTLSALFPEAFASDGAKFIFEETTTLGIRVRAVDRLIAEREAVLVDTKFGQVPVKLKKLGGRIVAASPEYDECAALAQRLGLPLREVTDAVREASKPLITELRDSDAA